MTEDLDLITLSNNLLGTGVRKSDTFNAELIQELILTFLLEIILEPVLELVQTFLLDLLQESVLSKYMMVM